MHETVQFWIVRAVAQYVERTGWTIILILWIRGIGYKNNRVLIRKIQIWWRNKVKITRIQPTSSNCWERGHKKDRCCWI